MEISDRFCFSDTLLLFLALAGNGHGFWKLGIDIFDPSLDYALEKSESAGVSGDLTDF